LQVWEPDLIVTIEQRVDAGEAHHLRLRPGGNSAKETRATFGQFFIYLVPERTGFFIAAQLLDAMGMCYSDSQLLAEASEINLVKAPTLG
jgi:hypothetical protein